MFGSTKLPNTQTTKLPRGGIYGRRGGYRLPAARFRYQIVIFRQFGVKAILDAQVGVLAFCKKLVKLRLD